MAVPKTVREVPRPNKTVVVKKGNRYVVRATIPSSSRKNKKTKYGRVIGYIENLQFIPIEEYYKDKTDIKPFQLSLGGVILFLSVALNVLPVLISIFGVEIAYQMFVIVALKILYPGVTESTASYHYKNSFLSVLFPNVNISKNKVSELFRYLGLKPELITEYKDKIISSIASSDIIYIDGSYKQYNSNRNFLSKTPIKKKFKGYEVINVITSYISSISELLASIYPGSFSDISVFAKYLLENKITCGILIGDSAFLPSIVKRIKEQYKDTFGDLQYIGCLRSNDKRIKELNLLENNFDGAFESAKGNVYFKKIYNAVENTFLYVFKNLDIAYGQENLFLIKEKKKESLNFKEDYDDVKDTFGIRIYESELDLDPKELYEIILERWIIEVIFHREKSDLELNCTRVHDPFSVIGVTFVDIFATSIYIKIVNKLESCGLTKSLSCKNIIRILNDAYHVVTDDEREKLGISLNYLLEEGKPKSNDSGWVHTSQKAFQILEKLGLILPADKEENTKAKTKQKNSKKSNKAKDPDEQTNIIENIENIKDLYAKLKKGLDKSDKDQEDISSSIDTQIEALNDIEKKCKELTNSRTNSQLNQGGETSASTTSDTNSDETAPDKVKKQRKVRSDKGVPRGPYKKKVKNGEEQAVETSPSPTSDTNSDETAPDKVKKQRKVRSDKGVPRGSYKKKVKNGEEQAVDLSLLAV